MLTLLISVLVLWPAGCGEQPAPDDSRLLFNVAASDGTATLTDRTSRSDGQVVSYDRVGGRLTLRAQGLSLWTLLQRKAAQADIEIAMFERASLDEAVSVQFDGISPEKALEVLVTGSTSS